VVSLDQDLYTLSDLLTMIDSKLTAAGLTNVKFTDEFNYITLTSADSFKFVAFGDHRD
jgi:hypothetical protein